MVAEKTAILPGVTVHYGNCTGKYFTQWRVDKLLEVANALYLSVGIDTFCVWYDESKDFHRLEFVYNNDKYYVQMYKIMTLHRERGNCKRYFEQYTEYLRIPHFFKTNKHKEPWPNEPGYIPA